jgi:TonB family protein
MRHLRNENVVSLLLTVTVIAGVSIACARIKGLTAQNKQSDEVNKFYYDLPYGFESADLDAGRERQEAFVVVIPDSKRIMLQSVESAPITLAQLDEQLKAFAESSPDLKKPVYIAATYDLEWSAIIKVLGEVQKYNIENVKLLVGPEARSSDNKGNTTQYDKRMGDVPAPDRVFAVKIGDQLPPPIKMTPGSRNESVTIPNTISGGVLNGKATTLPKPAYPDAARAVRASGPVTVQVTVDSVGSVIAANAIIGHLLLRNEAVKAARLAKFAPTMLGGKPVKMNGILVYNFVP